MTLNQLFDTSRTTILDGGMGTMLQAAGLPLGVRPETLALTQPDLLERIHHDYAEAGAQLLYANTFGASEHKLAGTGYTVEQLVPAAIACARRAAADTGALVALDIGPLGELLEPAGTLRFEDAYEAFARTVRAGQDADVIVLETMTDLYEVKAALLACRENSDKPVLVSMTFEANGRSFTGCCVESFAAVAAGLGASAIGINCSLGPTEILPLARRLCACVPNAGIPVFVKPNRGLPRADGSGYDMTAEQFAAAMEPYKELGVSMVGGCCGTDTECIRLLAQRFAGFVPPLRKMESVSRICTPVRAVEISGPTVVGERLNPTGKKRFQQALREQDMDYLLSQAVSQMEAGAQLLDVNVGLPGVDEPALMVKTVRALQAVVDLPLVLDSSDPAALERGLRVYNGKPLVNSVNGKQEVLDTILPLCKKYGAAVIGLTLDESGIPAEAEARVAVARRIRDAALAAGIEAEDIYIDCLTLTASAQQDHVMDTLQALETCKRELGVRTILGVSNISFGLPCREYLNVSFLTLAMARGLDLAILNPNAEPMMAAVASYRVLSGIDAGSTAYIARYANAAPAAAAAQPGQVSLEQAVEQGLKSEAAAAARRLLETTDPLEVVNAHLVPALDRVGQGFEKGTLFLPQLLQSAAAAQSAFEQVRVALAEKGGNPVSRGAIVLATVQGDIHDIGKNIVKVLLENYGYQVTDLGRDVAPERVVEAVRRTGAPLVGLSALMTTTLPSMRRTIELLRQENLPCKVVVGGAVLTPEYAAEIGADFYARDAKATADIANKLFG